MSSNNVFIVRNEELEIIGIYNKKEDAIVHASITEFLEYEDCQVNKYVVSDSYAFAKQQQQCTVHSELCTL